MKITSLTNAKVKQWMKYKEKKHRDADKKFLIEGEHLLQEAHKAGIIDCILVEEGSDGAVCGSYETYEVSSDILKKLCSSVSGSRLMAVCRYPKEKELDGSRYIVLDDVQDPGNLGTIIRCALSFGYEGILLSKHCVDVYNEKVIRSTQGACFHLPVYRCDLKEGLAELKTKGIALYATALRKAVPLQELQVSKRHALIFGNEGKGIREEILLLCDVCVKIEMETFESLNVAVAAGICMYEAAYGRKQR